MISDRLRTYVNMNLTLPDVIQIYESEKAACLDAIVSLYNYSTSVDTHACMVRLVTRLGTFCATAQTLTLNVILLRAISDREPAMDVGSWR